MREQGASLPTEYQLNTDRSGRSLWNRGACFDIDKLDVGIRRLWAFPGGRCDNHFVRAAGKEVRDNGPTIPLNRGAIGIKLASGDWFIVYGYGGNAAIRSCLVDQGDTSP